MPAKLTDDDIFPFGKNKELKLKMKDVPASYFDWLRGQEWLPKWPAVVEYMERNQKVIDAELEEPCEREVFDNNDDGEYPDYVE